MSFSSPFGQPQSSVFGGSSSFGQPQTSPFGAAAPFGQSQPSAFGGTSTFGQPTQPAFGQPQTSAFGGASTSPFGKPAAFGSAPTTSAFGAKPAFGAGGSSLFGQSQAPTTSAFGQPSLSPFGASQPTAATTTPFGAPAATATPFGQASPFGGQAQQQPSASPFGQGSFGTPASSAAFGQSSFGSSAFGQTTTAFGAPSSTAFGQSTSAFGTPSSNPFGQSSAAFGGSSTFGATQQNPFGQQSTSSFGQSQPSSIFGQSQTTTPFGAAQSSFGSSGQAGTGHTKFAPTAVTDMSASSPAARNGQIQVISAMQQYSSKSLEELRMEDYQQGRTGGGAQSAPFGGAAATPFGQQPTTSVFGQSQPAFGQQQSQPAFGQQPFGQSTPFGQSQPAPFGQSNNAFGQPANNNPFGQTTTSTFGQPTSSAFGQTSAPFGQSQPAFGQGFGAKPAFGQSTPSFGQTAPTQGFGASNPFGQTSAAFGSTTFGQSNAFGKPQTAFGAPSTSFGSTPSFSTPQWGVATAGGPTSATPNLFGASQPHTMFGAPSSQPMFGASSSFGATQPSFSTMSMPTPPQPPRAPSTVSTPPMGHALLQSPPPTTPSQPAPTLASVSALVDSVFASTKTPVSTTKRSPASFRVSPRTHAVVLPRQYDPSALLADTAPPRPGSGLTPPKATPPSSGADFTTPPPSLPTHKNFKRLIDRDESPKQYGSGSPSLITFSPKASTRPSLPGRFACSSPPAPKRLQVTDSPKVGLSLKRPGVYVIPRLDQLSRMDTESLKAVKDLEIGCHKLGSIRFLEPIDVTQNIDVDAVVEFQGAPKNSVSVNTSVPGGEHLNRHAEITLEGCFPKGPMSVAAAAKYEQRLKKACLERDAEFVSYTPEQGIWKFTVKHFSRYGLDSDDEDDDDDEPELDLVRVESVNTSRHGVPSDDSDDGGASEPSLADLPLPRVIPTLPQQVGVPAREMHLMKDVFFAEDGSDGDAEDTDFPFTSPTLRMQFSHSKLPRRRSPTPKQDFEPFPTPTQQSRSPSPPRRPPPHAKVVRGPPYGQSVASVARAADMGRAMGRSFRVCWSPSGQIYVPQRPVAVVETGVEEHDYWRQQHRIAVVDLDMHFARDPIFTPEPGTEAVDMAQHWSRMTAVYFATSTASLASDGRDESAMELTTASDAPKGEDWELIYQSMSQRLENYITLEEERGDEEAASVWKLVWALWGASETHVVTAAAENSYRRKAVSDWLKVCVRAEVDKEIAERNSGVRGRRDPLWDVFTYLTGFRIHDAVRVAIEHEHPQLATLIAQAGSPTTLQKDLQEQLAIWQEGRVWEQRSEKERHTNNTVACILALLSGSLFSAPGEKKVPCEHTLASLTAPLSWRRLFGLHLWFHPTAHDSDQHYVKNALDNFDMASGLAGDSQIDPTVGRVPCPSYLISTPEPKCPWCHANINPNDSSPCAHCNNPFILDVCYNLLKRFEYDSFPLPLALHPFSYTPCTVDYHLCWHLYQVLKQLSPSVPRDALGRDGENFLTASYVHQLGAAGEWLMAARTIVASDFGTANARDHYLRAFIARHARVDDDHTRTLALFARAPAIPPAWLFDALSCIACSEFNVESEIDFSLARIQAGATHDSDLRPFSLLLSRVSSLTLATTAPALVFAHKERELLERLERLRPCFEGFEQCWNEGLGLLVGFLELKFECPFFTVPAHLSRDETLSLIQNVTSLVTSIANFHRIGVSGGDCWLSHSPNDRVLLSIMSTELNSFLLKLKAHMTAAEPLTFASEYAVDESLRLAQVATLSNQLFEVCCS